MKIFIATKNQKKLEELRRILIPMGFEVLSERDLEKPLDDIAEDGSTFEENAIIKANSGLKATGLGTTLAVGGSLVSGVPDAAKQ